MFDRIEGVTETYVGYTQGNVANPTYEQVCSGSTNHTEGIQIYFDPQVVSYRSLIDTMLGHADPTTLNRQGNDRGEPGVQTGDRDVPLDPSNEG